MNILESYHRTKETLLTWKLFFTEKMGNYVLEFCTVFSTKRLVKHIITNNNLINTSVQKGCMDKVPGCWEHMSKVWSALKEARSTKSSFANIWLDIANAYGSIPHRLLFFALERYGVDPHWISLIKIYYSGIYSRSFSQSGPSSWHQHFKGIFAGCTLSIILFLAGINVVIEYTLASSADIGFFITLAWLPFS